MKKRGIFSNFILIMAALSASLVLLWVIFYYLTMSMIRNNMKLQAQASSDAIMARVEEELITLESVAYEMSSDERIVSVAESSDATGICDAGASVMQDGGIMRNLPENADNVIVFNPNGLFYRLNGTVSNTTLNRVFYLMENGGNKTIFVSNNKNTYIGAYESVYVSGGRSGYVVLLMEQNKIERILSTYDDLGYLGTALLSGDKVLCSNRDIRYEDIDRIRERSIFTREKDIGLSGFRLLVWCDNTISIGLSRYFRVAMPVTVAILFGIILFYIRYIKTRMIDPVRNDMEQKERALVESELTLLKKQISAHFTVNTLNVVRALINKGDKEAAAQIRDELSVLLRYANAGDEQISLMDEFYVLHQYVGIMQTRYPGRIDADIDDANDAYAEVYIPRMVVQPIVENAIVHGLAGGAGHIRVSADIERDMLRINVSDNGQGMSRERLEEVRRMLDAVDAENEDYRLEHVALRNIHKRIRLICGPEYGVNISSDEGKGTEVCVRLPVRYQSAQ